MRQKLPEYLLGLCRQFRKNPTDTETMLWQCLRDRNLGGYKFRRQHPIGRFIADFYCDELKLIIEVNGSIHNHTDRVEYDSYRHQVLEDQGYSVIRVTTTEVRQNLAGVLGKLTPLTNPSTRGRGDKIM